MDKKILIILIICVMLGIGYYFYSNTTSKTTSKTTLNSSQMDTSKSIPLTIDGCSLWLDASDQNTLVLNNSNVSSWLDKSTNKFKFTQTNNTNQPQYDSITNTLKFTAANQNYLGGPKEFEIGKNSYALFLVFKFNDATTNGAVFNKSLYGGATGRILVVRENNGNFNMLVTDNKHENNPFKDTYPGNKYRVLSLIYNRSAGTANIYQNGVLINSYTYTTPENSYLNNSFNMVIGAYNNTEGLITPPQPGYYLDGNIAEIISYSNSYDMTITTQKQIENYLSSKWKIPLE